MPAKPLAIIPTYLTKDSDLGIFNACIRTLRQTAELDVLVVDDRSPNEALRTAGLDRLQDRHGFDLVRREVNAGFATTVNVGLQQALDEGRDAILVNADIEFQWPWLEPMLAQPCLHSEGLPSVVGGLLLYPNSLIQSAGTFFSVITRSFDHRMRFGPGNLPEAQVPKLCPVTGALQLIRHECLENIGLFDEEFGMGFEDVDYCLRVLLSGRESVYAPTVRAFHHESVFRARVDMNDQHLKSMKRLSEKWGMTDLAGLCPPI
jgi:GT2 family glycosyltransferase